MKFTRIVQGITFEGEIVSIKPGEFLKVRVDSAPDRFITTQYHLISVVEGCALRILVEIYETGETHHLYFPEAVEQEWQTNLKRLRNYCEAG
jgi:hypothetical protein